MDLAARTRLPADKRRAVIEGTALRLFAESGYADTRLDDIAAAAMVTKPVLYRHFASKKALYLALLERHEQGQQRFVGPSATGASFVARLPVLLDGWFARIEDQPDTWKLIFRDSTGDADIQAARRRLQAGARTNILRILEDQPELSIPPDELIPLAELFRSAMVGLALWRLEHPDVARPIVVDLATRAIRGLLGPSSLPTSR